VRRLTAFGQNPAGAIGLLTIGLFAAVALLAPWVAPHDPWAHARPFVSPSPAHLLGTNDMGQDIFSELLYGARVSLFVGFLAASVSLAIGVMVGVVAGYCRGWIDEVLMAVTDVFLMLPGLPLAILLAAYLGPGLWNIIAVIGIVAWPSTARVVRSQVLTIRELGYVEASKAAGVGDAWILLTHVLPNASSIVLAKFVLTVGSAMLVEASLSFLGLGDPAAKSWGGMLYYAFSRGGFVRDLWWWYLPPGFCIGLCVLSFSLFSFATGESLDPRLRRVLSR
jgi:peptide/nickel transport system permease protein